MDKSKIEKIVRGSIWWTNFGYNTVNMHTQKGKRPCIVVSNDKNNFFSPVVNICPITTKRDDLEMIHPVVYVDGVKSYIMVEQIATIDKANLFTYVGMAEKKTIQTMDKALRLQLNLSTGANELHTKLDMLIETTKRIEENQKIVPVVNTEPVKTVRKPKLYKERSRKNQKWSEDRKNALIDDSNKLTADEIVLKYNFKDKKTAQTYIAKFKKEYGLV